MSNDYCFECGPKNEHAQVNAIETHACASNRIKLHIIFPTLFHNLISNTNINTTIIAITMNRNVMTFNAKYIQNSNYSRCSIVKFIHGNGQLVLLTFFSCTRYGSIVQRNQSLNYLGNFIKQFTDVYCLKAIHSNP